MESYSIIPFDNQGERFSKVGEEISSLEKAFETAQKLNTDLKKREKITDIALYLVCNKDGGIVGRFLVLNDEGAKEFTHAGTKQVSKEIVKSLMAG